MRFGPASCCRATTATLLFATATGAMDPALWNNAAFRYALQSAYDALIDPLAALQST